jgi:hypothetical protein
MRMPQRCGVGMPTDAEMMSSCLDDSGVLKHRDGVWVTPSKTLIGAVFRKRDRHNPCACFTKLLEFG